MKRFFYLLILICLIGSINAQDSLEYTFDKARVHLAKREIKVAIESLRKIYIEQPENANINFLMGAAYTELSGTQDEAIFHLKKALSQVNENYSVGSFKEKGAPIHIYYYLAIALVEQDECAQANKAYERFKKYKEKVNSYFIEEVDRHLQKCPFDESEETEDWNAKVEVPEGYDPKFIEVKEKIVLDSAALAERGLVTQKLEYTTNSPLYGVQIGSNVNPSPTSSYSKIKNVDVFIDNEGIIRYVVGHFSYRKQADNLLKSLQAKGYSDAFVVNVNNERKYSNEVISYNNVNLRAGIRGSVDYYVQLGAFKEDVPADILKLYTKIDDIQELKSGELTLLLVGELKNYQVALNELDNIKREGVADAFIVAYHKGKRISLEEAVNFSE